MNPIEMLLDEENELTFQVNIEGNRPADASCRLRLDNKSVGLMFEANKTPDGEISVVIPPLKHVLQEGVYDMTLEVIVDDKYFQPLTIQGSFEKSVKVTAEAVVRTRKPSTSVTASTLVERKNKEATPVVTVKNSRTSSQKRRTIAEKRKTVQNKNKQLSDKDIMNLIEMLVKDQNK